MKRVVLSSVVLFCSTPVLAASIEKAELLERNGLSDDAKRELVEVIFSKQPPGERARAYYVLGTISFSERRVAAALDAWRTLVAEFPKAPEAALVEERIEELAEIVGEVERETIQNAVAQSYLDHAHFWSRRREVVFQIDSSWIGAEEAAIKWYDRVIGEFPGSAAAQQAYEGKLRTLLGWDAEGRYGSAGGVRGNLTKYLPMLIETFGAYTKAFPASSSHQAFRYQIAQVYWKAKDWKNTRRWLERIIEVGGPSDSFYTDLAKRRLQKVEY